MSDINKITDYSTKLSEVLNDVRAEIYRAKSKHPGDFKNYHEAYAVFLEEADELWDLIKSQKPLKQDIRDEAIQACAMLVRLMAELI